MLMLCNRRVKNRTFRRSKRPAPTACYLSPDRLLEAYRRGIFPMPIRIDGRRLIAWLTPDPRGVLEFAALHISRRVQRRLKRGEFQFTVNQAFHDVVEA